MTERERGSVTPTRTDRGESRPGHRSDLQVVIQSQLGEFILEMDPEVHVLHRVHHDVDELHARHLQPHVDTFRSELTSTSSDLLFFFSYHEVDISLFTAEVIHQSLKAMLLLTDLSDAEAIHQLTELLKGQNAQHVEESQNLTYK